MFGDVTKCPHCGTQSRSIALGCTHCGHQAPTGALLVREDPLWSYPTLPYPGRQAGDELTYRHLQVYRIAPGRLLAVLTEPLGAKGTSITNAAETIMVQLSAQHPDHVTNLIEHYEREEGRHTFDATWMRDGQPTWTRIPMATMFLILPELVVSLCPRRTVLPRSWAASCDEASRAMLSVFDLGDEHLQVVDPDGKVICPGDTVIGHRDEEHRFEALTRAPQPGKSAKILVSEPCYGDRGDGELGECCEHSYHPDGRSYTEYYLFRGLFVREVAR